MSLSSPMNMSTQRSSLLPGVVDAFVTPAVVADSRKVMAKARRRAVFRDAFDLLLLGMVDVLFLRWPHAHVPMFDRGDSLGLLLAVNAVLIAYLWLARAFPRWRARRVSATWTVAERTRLLNSLER
jgi:hypothetical protein